MDQPPRVVMQNDLQRFGTVVRLEAFGAYVERFITAEEAESATYYPELVRATIQGLCEDWLKRFGGHRLAIAPKAEGAEWSVYYDNTIDGEVVVKEIEGGDKNASRGCIEGR